MSGDGRPGTATEVFVAHRNLLFTVAYEMLGSAADAEDVLQETWQRWADVDLDTVRDQRAYLVRVATRQALTRLRTLGRRKESYVGPWLPEPLLTTPDVGGAGPSRRRCMKGNQPSRYGMEYPRPHGHSRRPQTATAAFWPKADRFAQDRDRKGTYCCLLPVHLALVDDQSNEVPGVRYPPPACQRCRP